MMKYNHTHQPAKRHTGQIKPSGVDVLGSTDNRSDEVLASEPISTNTLTNSNNEGYYKDLSKISLAVKPYRYHLAFFVFKNWCDPQPIQYNSAKQFTQQGKTVVSMVCKLPPYDGLTLQNKKAFWRICKAVSSDTESKTRYLNFFKVALTQKLLGGLSNA